MKEKIKELYIKGYTSFEISDILNISNNTIRATVNRNLKDCRDIHNKNKSERDFLKKEELNNHIKSLYLKGYNAKEIAGFLKFNHKYMREYISENLKKYKLEHVKNRNINKSIMKSIDGMNNMYMANSSFLNWNRQSYDYNKNGNIVFNENRGARVKDVPKAFYKREGIVLQVEDD